MIVRIATEDRTLGLVEPPEYSWMNHVHWANPTSTDWNNLHKTLDLLHQKFFDVNPEPDTDEEFIDYLVGLGWKRCDLEIVNHVI